MTNLRKALLMFALLFAFGVNPSSAQVQVYVHARPHVPHYERVARPSPHHVWIDEDWEPRGGSYVFIGGHWAEPPHHGAHWAPGHWRHGHGGWVWAPGHWR